MKMYSKVYWIGCAPENSVKMMEHYDSVLTPAIKSSEHHLSHQMIEIEPGKYCLISNYHSKAAADAAGPLVQQLVKPMIEQFGMTLEPVTEGEVVRSI